MSKIVRFIYYWNRKVIVGRKGVFYEDPPPTVTVIRSQAIFDEFMDKFYHVTGCEKQYIRLPLTCRYPVTKEYITLPITDQETLEIAFGVVSH